MSIGRCVPSGNAKTVDRSTSVRPKLLLVAEPNCYGLAVGAEDVQRIEDALASVVGLVGLPRVHERLLAKAGVRIDPTAYPVLRVVSESEPLRLSELTRLLGVDVSTASRTVKRLVLDGLVVKRLDVRDGRASELWLSERGRELLRRLRAARHELIGEVFAEWSRDDLASLAPLLERAAQDLQVHVLTGVGGAAPGACGCVSGHFFVAWTSSWMTPT